MPKRNGLSRNRGKQGLIPIDKEAIRIIRSPEKTRKAENEKRLKLCFEDSFTGRFENITRIIINL